MSVHKHQQRKKIHPSEIYMHGIIFFAGTNGTQTKKRKLIQYVKHVPLIIYFLEQNGTNIYLVEHKRIHPP